MNTIMKWGAAFVAALFELWLGRIRKANEDKDAGRQEVIKGAKDDAAERNKVAQDSDDAWARMSDDERERVRNDKGHYRD